MARIRYQVAASLDGYMAGPNGEADWTVMDPEIDFEGLFRIRHQGSPAESA